MKFFFGNISIEHYVILSILIFTIGFAGVLMNRRNIISILISVELMLLAVNINMIAFSTFYQNIIGQIFSIFIMTVAAAEVSIALAILIVFFRANKDISVKLLSKLRW